MSNFKVPMPNEIPMSRVKVQKLRFRAFIIEVFDI